MFLLIHSSSRPCAVAQPRPATRKPAHHHGPCPLDPGPPRRDRGRRDPAPSFGRSLPAPPPPERISLQHIPHCSWRAADFSASIAPHRTSEMPMLRPRLLAREDHRRPSTLRRQRTLSPAFATNLAASSKCHDDGRSYAYRSPRGHAPADPRGHGGGRRGDRAFQSLRHCCHARRYAGLCGSNAREWRARPSSGLRYASLT
jgi:hypothetical protein